MLQLISGLHVAEEHDFVKERGSIGTYVPAALYARKDGGRKLGARLLGVAGVVEGQLRVLV